MAKCSLLLLLLATTVGAAPPSAAPARMQSTLPAVAQADGAMMKAAIDDQLGMLGYGKLCIDGPDSFPAVVYSDDEDAALQMQVKGLLDIGFIRVTSVRTVGDRVTATQYDLTQAGTRFYGTYRKLGFGGDFHGWCFADYRVDRIVSSESGPFCRQPSRLLRGFAAPDSAGRCVTIVTYLPRITASADWIRLPPAKEFALVAAFGKFSQTALTATLAPVGDTWQAVTSALGVAAP